MPRRKTPLIKGSFAHVYNRCTHHIPIFDKKIFANHFINVLSYYRYKSVPVSYSKFRILPKERRDEITKTFDKTEKHVDILAYCVMPTHFHLLLKQLTNNGIEHTLKNVSSSFSHFVNLKNETKGSVFEGRYNALSVLSEEQLLHLSRYIHLNPYSAGLVEDYDELVEYAYSSLKDYLSEDKSGLTSTSLILDIVKDYGKFVFDRADYQRSLEKIKHLV